MGLHKSKSPTAQETGSGCLYCPAGDGRVACTAKKFHGELRKLSKQKPATEGNPYCSHAYFLLTQNNAITASMSQAGNCLDNAALENFFGQLKEEAIYQTKLLIFQQAQEIIDDYIYFYNYQHIELKTKLIPFDRRCQFQ